jgi:hypothetical protein
MHEFCGRRHVSPRGMVHARGDRNQPRPGTVRPGGANAPPKCNGALIWTGPSDGRCSRTRYPAHHAGAGFVVRIAMS